MASLSPTTSSNPPLGRPAGRGHSQSITAADFMEPPHSTATTESSVCRVGDVFSHVMGWLPRRHARRHAMYRPRLLLPCFSVHRNTTRIRGGQHRRSSLPAPPPSFSHTPLPSTVLTARRAAACIPNMTRPQHLRRPSPTLHAAFIASPLVLATHSAVPTLRSRPSPSTHHEWDASCTSPTYALRPSSATLHRLLKARSCRATRVLRAPPPAYAAHAAALSSQGRSGEPSSRRGHAVIARPFGPTIFFESPSRKPNVEFLPTPQLLCEMQSFESGLTAKQADLEQPFFDEASVNRSEGSRPRSAFRTYRGPPLLEKPCFKSSAVTASTIFVRFCPYFKARFHHSSFLLPTMSESTNATAPLELVDGVNALELQCEELKRLNSAFARDHGKLHAHFIALATDFKELAAEYEKLYAEYDALVEDHKALATKHEVLATKYQRLRALHAHTVIPSHVQLSTFRHGSPPSLLENLNATTRSVPATPLGISNSMVHIFKSPGTPHMPETQALNGRLASVSENVVNAGDLQASLSRLPLGQLMVSRTSTAAKADSTSLRAMPLFSSLVVNYSISSPKSRLLPVCLLPTSDLPY
ncbi:hypothetical protein K438DRAFT_2067555 [Mycena galopus ATCC 62051]|nr:hypothetical protein K438DRAFT_2067555 [Mycena galopus ATCC 62051]